MPFRFNCENCDVRIKVPDGSEGKKVKCPSCGQAQRVPGEAVTAAAVAATQPARPVAKQPVAATSATPPKAAAKIASTPSSEAKTTPVAKPKREASRPAPPAAPVKAAEQDDALAALAAAAGADAPTEPTPVRRHSTRPVAAEPVSAPEPAPTRIDTPPAPAVVSPPAEQSVISDVPAANPVDEHIEDHQALQAFLAATEPVVQAVPPASEFVAPPDVPHETTSSQGAEVTLRVDAPPVESAEPETTLADAATSAQELIELNEASPPPSSPMSASMDALFGTAPKATAASLAEQPTEPDAASSESQGEDEESGITRIISASEVGEAPAGEVRDLFDDFVRKETIEREAESQAKTSHEVAAMEPAPSVKPPAATRAAARVATAPQTVAEPSPVVVVKTPPRVMRGGTAAVKPAAVVAPLEPVIEPVDVQADVEAQSLAVAAAALQARRAPLAIPLSSAAPAVAVIPPVDAATFEDPAPAEPVMAAPMAKARRTAPAPAYSLLIVLCWALRLLACLSLVSVVKLTLMALDADYKPVDVAIIAPLGVGISAAIWAVGEVARVARDAARNSHR